VAHRTAEAIPSGSPAATGTRATATAEDGDAFERQIERKRDYNFSDCVIRLQLSAQMTVFMDFYYNI
jgi:hypothetical protein